MWGPFSIELAIGPRRAFELPFVKPKLFGSAPGGVGVEHAIVGDDALEAIGVAENPIRHVSAVAGAQSAFSVFVDEGVMLLGVVEAFHQVFKGSASPIAVDGVDEFLPVAG